MLEMMLNLNRQSIYIASLLSILSNLHLNIERHYCDGQ